MTLGELYKLSVQAGIDTDPRGKEGVQKHLDRKKKQYEKLSGTEKAEFDVESLTNPYSDSRILLGDPNKKITKVLAGIDIDAAEVTLAELLNLRGEGIDLILGHHPLGMTYAMLHDVMDMQVDLLARYGVPVNVTEGLLRDRISEVQRKINPKNVTQALDAAKLLGFPVMCTHTITDNMVYKFLEEFIESNSFDTVGDIVTALKEIPEYQEAMKNGVGPVLFTGNSRNRAGKVAPLEITGGTNAAANVYEKLSHAGIGTIISMHASEEHRAEAQKHHINLVVAGHMSSDSLGMNLLLDMFEKNGVEVVACSGLIRVKRS